MTLCYHQFTKQPCWCVKCDIFCYRVKCN